MRLIIDNLENKKYKINLLCFKTLILNKLESTLVSFSDIEKFYLQNEKYPNTGIYYVFIQLIKTLYFLQKLTEDESHLYDSLPDWNWKDRELYTIKYPKLFIKSFFGNEILL